MADIGNYGRNKCILQRFSNILRKKWEIRWKIRGNLANYRSQNHDFRSQSLRRCDDLADHEDRKMSHSQELQGNDSSTVQNISIVSRDRKVRWTYSANQDAKIWCRKYDAKLKPEISHERTGETHSVRKFMTKRGTSESRFVCQSPIRDHQTSLYHLSSTKSFNLQGSDRKRSLAKDKKQWGLFADSVGILMWDRLYSGARPAIRILWHGLHRWDGNFNES
jgi:hypothetical protein